MYKRYLALFLAIFLVTLALTSAVYKRDVYDSYGSPTGYAREKVNYSLFNAENYTGVRANFTGNVTASWFKGILTWSYLTGYPSTCTSNQYISALGDTISCASISIAISQITDIVNADVNRSDFWDDYNTPADIKAGDADLFDGYNSLFYMPLNQSLNNNFDFNAFNLTAEMFIDSTDGIEWIMPEHIFDVDDADIETDLNTYWDIAGDSDSGSYVFNFTNSNLTMDYFFGNGSQLTGISETDPFWTANSSLYRLLTNNTFLGNASFDTSTLFIDSVSNRIGIGTATPQNKLNVIGDGNFTGTLYYGTLDGEGNLDVNSSDFWDDYNVPDDIVYSDLYTDFWDANVDLGNYNFTVNGTTLFVDTNTGNVGIGTTSPISKLTVIGDITLDNETTGVDANSPYTIFRGNDFTTPTNWADGDSTRCKDITITISGSTLTDFPVYINISYDSDMQEDYDDLRFYDTDCNNGGNLLNYEIENYTTTKADVWVKTTLTSGANVISVYYGNAGASSGENPTGVWDDNYKMVQHMYDITTSTIEDSTQYNNDGTKKGANEPIENVSGRIDSAQTFDGSNDYINTGYNPTWTSTQSYTFIAWFKTNSTVANQIIMGTIAEKGPSDPHTFFAGVGVTGGGATVNKLGFNFRDDNNNAAGIIESSSDVNDGNWHFVASVRDVPSDKYYLYLDGVLVNSNTDTTTGGFDFSNFPSYIGAFNIRGTSNWFFNGTIDEVRISNTTRTADWINQSYQLVANQGTYVVFGSEETLTGTNTEINMSQRLIINSLTDYRLVFTNTVGTEIFSILGNGNVGIGTATPQNKLNVIGLVNATGFIVNASSGYSGYCVNTTYVGGIATSCND